MVYINKREKKKIVQTHKQFNTLRRYEEGIYAMKVGERLNEWPIVGGAW